MTNPLRRVLWLVLSISAAALSPQIAAQSNSSSAKALGVAPAHDAFDIPFRRAPMALSSRSIVVSLATNLHLAFDATLLRVHSVWEGEPLNLYGPPFNGNATRFICDFSGPLLWGNLPIQPWELARMNSADFESANGRFIGVSTRGGRTSFRCELIPAAGPAIQLEETPRLERILSENVVIRHFEVVPFAVPIRFSPFYGPGDSSSPINEHAFMIRREKDCLLVASRGINANKLTARSDPNAHEVLIQNERDGKGPYSAIVTNTIRGPHAQISLTLQPNARPTIFEIATAVCSDQMQAIALAKAFVAGAKPETGKDAFHRVPDFSSNSAEPKSVRDEVDRGSRSEPTGDESFIVEHFPIPTNLKLLVGGMDFLPNGDLAVCTYAGEIWIVEGATGNPIKTRWRRFARGLNEPGGLRVINGEIYVTQKCELTRVLDTDSDGEADLFQCLSDAWGYTGNYHSYATGPALDALGNLYIMITGHRTIYDVSFMGWCVRVSPEVQSQTQGQSPKSKVQSLSGNSGAGARFMSEGFCSGLRVPNGFGEFKGELFMTDNQGHWIAANKLNHLQAGKFYGHPSAQPEARSRFNGDTNFTPPAVWFPYAWVRSASGIAAITEERFGPFQGQLLVGEFQNASVFRVALEKVSGAWQGAVFPFVKGFASGVNRIVFGPDGKLYAGGLRMGHWTSIAPQPYSLDRVSFTGKVPFEISEVHAQPDGFVLTFTQAVDPAIAGSSDNWDALQYTYGYDGRHNAPEKDRDEKIAGPVVRVTRAVVSDDRRSVRLHIEGCQSRHVIMVRALDVKNADGQQLRHDTFHYTLNRIPGK